MSKAVVRDHLGNEFKNKTEMCKYWNINYKTFDGRIKQGFSLEEALTTPHRVKHVCKDHLGNEYSSIAAMCDQYNITTNFFLNRRAIGWSLEDTLTLPAKPKVKVCKDHLGNVFLSQKEMCDYWDISSKVFISRIKSGWSLEDALTTPVGDCKQYKKRADHLGNKFSSQKEMCDYWNISMHVFKGRIASGWSLEDALTTPVKEYMCQCKDHLGNTYGSVAEMCRAWHITIKTYYSRRGRGCDIETSLTGEIHCSYLEKTIENYMVYKNINFIKEYVFSDCIFSDSNRCARFDFYLPDIGIIEVDGKQHFTDISVFGGISTLETTQNHDAIKTKYCEENNIPLLRVRYDQLVEDAYQEMIEDFLSKPAKYVKIHNTFLDDEEYYTICEH